MENVLFFVQSIKNLKTVGTLFPCSKVSAAKMTAPIDFTRAKIIVELGSGTGAITKEILRNMRSEAQLFAFEMNPSFCGHLENLGDTRLTVLNRSAEEIIPALRSHGIEKVDYVISTIPLALIPSENRAKLYRSLNSVIDRKGRYVQIQYTLISRWELSRCFNNLKIDFTPWNLPPAFFYTCEPKRLEKNPQIA